MAKVRVAAVGELTPGVPLQVEAGGWPLLVVRTAGGLRAVENLCSHDGALLGGAQCQGEEILCPRHGGRFDLASGRATHMPAVAPITSYPVWEQDGGIYVEVEE